MNGYASTCEVRSDCCLKKIPFLLRFSNDNTFIEATKRNCDILKSLHSSLVELTFVTNNGIKLYSKLVTFSQMKLFHPKSKVSCHVIHVPQVS